MSEKKKIRRVIAQHGRKAYMKAKERNKAFILLGNSIYNMGADGTKIQIESLSSTRVKAKVKKYRFS